MFCLKRLQSGAAEILLGTFSLGFSGKLSVCIRVFYLKCLRSRAAQILLGTFSLGFLGKLSVLHTGVLTKTFPMSVLYLKTVLNCGLGAINGEDASKAGGLGSQRARFPVSLCGVQLACFPLSLRIGVQLAHLPFSRALKHLSARHLLAIKRVRRGVT